MFEPSRRVLNRFVLIVSDWGQGYVLWLAKVLLLFRLNTRLNSAGAEYVFLQCVGYTLAAGEASKHLDRLCTR